MNTQQKIKAIRTQIDAADDAINSLLAKRTQLVHQMKQAKGDNAAIFQPEREAEIIARVTRQNSSSLPDEEVAKIFSQIVLSCRTLEEIVEAK